MEIQDLTPASLGRRTDRSAGVRYGLGLLIYLLAVFLTAVLWEPLFRQVPFALFFLAAAYAAWLVGLGPSILVSALGAVTVGLSVPGGTEARVVAPLVAFAVSAGIGFLMQHRQRAVEAAAASDLLLETERARLEAIVQQMPVGVILAKAPSGELVLANAAAAEVLHHPVHLVGSVEEYRRYTGFHDDGRPYEPSEYPLARSLATGQVVDQEEMDYAGGDGVRRRIAVSSAPIRDPGGDIVGGLAVLTDLTERRRLEQQLLQSQRLESVGRLAGGVAHDFNNLLTAIIGHSALVLEQLEPEHAVRSQIEEIAHCGQQAAVLTQQLLAFSRRQVLQPLVLEPNRLIEDLAKLLRRLIGEDVALTTRLDPALGRVRADPGQVEQIIVNLAVNARDAMSGGGQLTIETSNVALDKRYTREHPEVQPGPYVLIAVSDTGVGMSKEIQAQIFEPFFTTKAIGHGTGLGLATVYGIVKQSGGSIWVYSEPGHGSTFKVYLPRVEAPADATTVGAAGEILTGTETILLVEDDAGVRRLVRSVLTTAGYTVLECQNGTEALLMSEGFGGGIALLLTDVVMPGMSGKELAAKVAARRLTVRVLYMSGYTDDAIVHHGILDAGTAFLEKPFSPAVVLRKVRAVIDAA